MPNFFPLIANATANIIQELPSGSFLDLSQSGIANSGNILVSGVVSATGNITANYFVGNGSLLTGISGGTGNTGNVTFDNINIIGTGNLHLQPDPANAGSYLDIFLTSGPDLHLVASAAANLILGQDAGPNVMTSWDGNVYVQSWNNGSNTQGGVWNFGGDGNLTTPGAINVGDMSIGELPGYITANANTGIIVNVSGPDGGFVVDYLKEDGNANTSGGELAFSSETGNATYRISLSDDLGDGFATKIWRFDGTGTMTAPGNIVTPTNFVGTSLRTNLTDFNWSEAITDITLGATTTITLANNVFGDPWTGQVTITDVTGTTQANATWWYEAVDGNQFILYTDSTLSTLVDSSAWTAYVSGGFAVTLDYGNIEINAQNITIRSDHGDYNNKIWTFNRAGQTVFPYQDVARGDNPSGNITGYAMVMGDGTGEAIISTPDGNINGTWSSQRLVINPGKGGDGTSGEGGDIYLWAGRGGDQDGSGGDIKIRGGQGGATNGAGGYIRIEGGDGNGSGGPPGFIEITGGSGGVGQNGGYVRIQGGQGQATGGDANIVGGVGQGGPGGPVNIVGGVSANGLAEYGNVNITSGASTWTFDNTGNLTLPTNSFTVNYANGIQVTLGGGGNANTGNVTFDNQTVIGTGDEYGGGGLYLAPGTNSPGNLQYLRVRGGDYPTHIHVDTGNNNYFDQYFGADFRYVKLEANGNIVINADDDNGNSATWTFDYNGNLTAPGELSAAGNITAGNFIGLGSNVDIVAGAYDWTFDSTGNLTTPQGMIVNGNVNFLGTDTALIKPADNIGLSLFSSGANGTITSFWTDDVGNLMSSNIAAIYTPLQGTQTVRIVNGNNGGNVAIYDFDNTGMFTTATLCAIGNVYAGNVSVSGNITGNTAGYTIGYRDIPQITFSANATAALDDAGKHYYSTTAGNLALTLPDNSSVAFPTGATLTLVVNAVGNLLVNQGTGVSLYMAGSSTTGNRVVGAYGLASVMKVAANTWVISGTGVY